jgi:uncharacterized protein (TIGR02246 family)
MAPMQNSRWGIAFALMLLLLAGSPRAMAASDEAAAIRQAMAAQQAAWNRGDVDTFMRTYKDAPDTTFVGSTVRKGYATILESYRRHYANRAQMGRLTYSDLDVRLLPDVDGEVRYAMVTGRFHLDRSEHGEVAQDDGIYSLLWEKTANGWKIILDHTS